MRALWRLAAALTVVLLCGFTCVSTAPQSNKNIVPASPSTSPTPPPSPTQASTPASITGIPMAAGEVGVSYMASLSAAGGPTPYTWSLDSGTMPGGLILGTDGSVKGVPTAAGTFSFTVKASDATNQYTTEGATIKVYTSLAVLTQPCAVKCNIGAGCRRCGGFGTVGGGVGPYTYRILGGAVPAGMSLSGLSLVGPFPAGTYSLMVLVTDGLGGQTTVQANWLIYGPATLSAGGSCSNQGNPPSCRTSGWSYSGGSPLQAPRVVIVGYSVYCLAFCYPVPTGPPPGWTVRVAGGVITISAGGVPCGAPTYGGTLTLQLIDPSQCATTMGSNRANLVVWLENNC